MLKIPLWRTQICKLRIWNADDFRLYLMSKYNISLEKYLCVKENHDILLFSPDVCEASHSDNDGDHSAVYIPHGVEGQRIMREFILSDVCPDEILWTKKYIAGEVEANDSLIDSKGELIHPIYKLYDVPLQEYKVGRDVVSAYVTYFFQALAAKKGIGAATNDGWVFAMILEAYQAYARKHDYEYVDEEKNIKLPMIRLTRAKFFMYSFIYIRGLQDFVVTGVKHNDNGSADFDNLLLRNMVDEKNHKKVTQILTNQLGLDPKFANEIIRIVTWANLSGVYQSCATFLRLYNKGNEPKKEDEEVFNKLESFIQENTYFGRLLKDLYDIIYKYRHYETIAEEETAKQLEALSKDFLKDLEELPQDDILI